MTNHNYKISEENPKPGLEQKLEAKHFHPIEPKQALKCSAIGATVGTILGGAADIIAYLATKGEYSLPVGTISASTIGLVTGLSTYVDIIQNRRAHCSCRSQRISATQEYTENDN